METEFNLSEKISAINDYELENDVHPVTALKVLEVEDIKEFIRLLKEPFTIPKSWDANTVKKLCMFFENRIDKLAGDKLNGN